MGANNWALCPRCAKERTAALDKMRAVLKRSYGAVPVEEFDAMRQGLTDCENMPVKATLREDYEIHGAPDGTVIVEYGCSCKVCGLTAEFTYRHELDV